MFNFPKIINVNMEIQPSPLHVLIIEDNLGDFILIEEYLYEAHVHLELTRASTFGEAKKILQHSLPYDAILLDLSLPDIEDSEVLVKNIITLAGKTPVIVLTGFTNKEFGVKTLSLGISDYLFKDELNASQLSKSIYYSIERKKIEHQLIESEKKYKSLFDSSPMPMWVLERNSLQFLNVNDAAIDLYGYSREEFLAMTVKELWAGESKTTAKQVWKSNLHHPFGLTVNHQKKNGDILHLEVKSNPIEFDGKPARVSMANNITARLKAEQALSLSEQRFKALVQDGSDLVMILDFEGKFTYVSPSSRMVLGIPSERLLTKTFFNYIHEEDIDKVKKCIFQLHEKKRIQISSYRIRIKKNQWRWIETIVTNLMDDPSVNGIIANSRDITDFVKQERALMESLKRYDIVAKATSDTITDYNVEKDIIKFNEGIQNMFGYSLEQIGIKGSWWEEKVHPEDIKRVKARTKQVFLNKENQLQIEYRFRCANGKYKHILDRSYLLKDEAGNPLRMIGSMQDITEIHNYIETIENHNARLKEIAWTQSHVVRAPLARIMGLIDLLQNHGELENKCQLLDNIMSSAQELDTIIRKISSKAEYPTEIFL